MDINFKIIGITDRKHCRDSISHAVESAARTGIKTIQIREKNLSDREFYDEALSITELSTRIGLTVFINDRYDIAQATSADGVHIGNEDLPLKVVRKFFNGIIGKTVKNKKEAFLAEKQGADYIAIGPFYKSYTKPQKMLLPPEIIVDIKKDVSIPVIAIGGITAENLNNLFSKGATGIAVSRALFYGDIKDNARKLITSVKKYGSN